MPTACDLGGNGGSKSGLYAIAWWSSDRERDSRERFEREIRERFEREREDSRGESRELQERERQVQEELQERASVK